MEGKDRGRSGGDGGEGQRWEGGKWRGRTEVGGGDGGEGQRRWRGRSG